MNYDVDYFIRKFEAIPEDLWATDNYDNGKGQYCAFGHCGLREKGKGTNQEADALCAVFNIKHLTVTHINDGLDGAYQQGSPKERILAALYDIKGVLQPKKEPSPKAITKYVSVPESITEQATQLILL